MNKYMDDHLEEYRDDCLHQRINVLVTVMLVLAVVLCLYIATQVLSYGYANLGGFMMFRVVTRSMEPTIPVGALLVTQEVDIASVGVNDIICFRTQVSEIWGKIVTHRVISVSTSGSGGVLLETKGDANLAADIFYVDQMNFVGKVIWHTGDGSILADMLALFTSKIGFMGCIVLPALLLSGMILKDSVAGIRRDLLLVLEEQQLQQTQSWEDDPLCGMTQEEYNEMYERIRAELMEELMQIYGEVLKEQQNGAKTGTSE